MRNIATPRRDDSRDCIRRIGNNGVDAARFKRRQDVETITAVQLHTTIIRLPVGFHGLIFAPSVARCLAVGLYVPRTRMGGVKQHFAVFSSRASTDFCCHRNCLSASSSVLRICPIRSETNAVVWLWALS